MARNSLIFDFDFGKVVSKTLSALLETAPYAVCICTGVAVFKILANFPR
jgi:hypothetical protein